MIRRPPRSSPFPCPAVFRSGDGADALALDEGATVGRAQKVDEVGLVGLHGRVAVDGHRNGLGEIAGGKAQRAARLTDIVNAGGRAAIGGGGGQSKNRGAPPPRYGGRVDLGFPVTLCAPDITYR